MRLFIVVISLLFVMPLFGLSRHERPRKRDKRIAFEQIELLQRGVLLVRLQTKQMSIDALKARGDTALANKIEKKLKKKNLDIINGFEKKFDFCTKYYFYSTYSEYIKNNEYDKIQFLNPDLTIDSLPKDLNHDLTFVAEFGTIEQDTLTFQHNKHFENGKYKQTTHGGTNFGFGVLKIKSNQFVQLRDPFPFYVRTFDSFPLVKRSKKNTIRKMNNKLTKFYLKAMKNN